MWGPVDLSDVIYVSWWAAKKPGLKRTSAAWLTDNDRPRCRYVLRLRFVVWALSQAQAQYIIQRESGGKCGERIARRPQVWNSERKERKWGEKISGSPMLRRELNSHFLAATLNTLLFRLCCAPDLNLWPGLGLWWYSPGPLLKAAERAARPDPGLVIHRLLDRLPQCIDFCFPNLQERSKEKIKNTVSLKLNKNPAQGRYLREQGVTAEVRISLHRSKPSSAWNPIIST